LTLTTQAAACARLSWHISVCGDHDRTGMCSLIWARKDLSAARAAAAVGNCTLTATEGLDLGWSCAPADCANRLKLCPASSVGTFMKVMNRTWCSTAETSRSSRGKERGTIAEYPDGVFCGGACTRKQPDHKERPFVGVFPFWRDHVNMVSSGTEGSSDGPTKHTTCAVSDDVGRVNMCVSPSELTTATSRQPPSKVSH